MADKVDLSLTGQVDPSDKNYYIVPIKGLALGEAYVGKFQWSFEDQALNDLVKNIWSNGFGIETNVLTSINKPKLISTNVARYQGYIQVTWSGTDYTDTSYNAKAFKRINVYVKDNSRVSPSFVGMGFIDQIGGTFSFPASPSSYTIRITAVSATGLESAWSDEFTVSAVTDAPSVPSGLTASWSGTDFVVSFTHDTTSSANVYLKEYIVKLIPASPTPFKEFSLTPTSGSSQKFSLSLEVNQAAFGEAQTQFSGTITSVDIYNNKSAPIAFTNTPYVSPLSTPTITAVAIANGYTVSYPTQTSNVFNLISIEEVESSASTAPTTGYAVVKTDKSNPSIVSAPNNNKRWVRARLNDKVNAFTAYSNIVAVTPVSPVVVDVDGPPNVTSVTTSGAIDTSGYLGFNAYADISWPAVTTGGIRGYRIRFSNDGGTTYSYVDSPGSGTTYRLGGLAVGSTYKIAVATYDEYNNTSTSYVSGPDVTVAGTPSVSNYITAGPFQFGVGVGGTATNKGLYFDSSNYWYINASNSARLKVGGSTSNYLSWDGSEFLVDGNISARTGTFRGNVSIISGGSLYSGTLDAGNLSGAGYILNSSGLTFNSSSVSGITTINAATGKFTTASAYIGSWDVNDSTLFKTTAAGTLSLNSSDATITTNSTGYTAGIGVPDSNNIVMWAGASKVTAPFRVYKDGSVYASALTITGYATSDQLAAKVSAADVTNNIGGAGVTTISGNKVRTGNLQSENWSGSVTNGTALSAAGTNINLNDGTITSKKFRIDTAGDAYFAGSLESGTIITAPQLNGGTITGSAINIGPTGGSPAYKFSVDSLGNLYASAATISGNITAKALTLDSGDYVTANGSFSLGNGILSYTPDGYITVGLNGSNKGLKFNPDQRVVADDNEYAHASSVTININGELTRGRAFYYGSTTIPGASNTSRAVYNRNTNTYETIAFVAGDIWMTVD
jgi:hypothetical protein